MVDRGSDAAEHAAAHEMREVVRVLEKFGLSELAVSAHGTLSPQLAVMRLCAFIASRDMDVELMNWVRTHPQKGDLMENNSRAPLSADEETALRRDWRGYKDIDRLFATLDAVRCGARESVQSSEGGKRIRDQVDPVGHNIVHILEWARVRRPDLVNILERAQNDDALMSLLAIGYAAGRTSVVAELEKVSITQLAPEW